jgi:polyisoprenoid-binding protein YceI
MSLIVTNSFAASKKVDVNIKKSTVEWHGKKVTGAHYGNVSIKSGSLKMNEGQLVGGEFVIDMTTLTCTDIGSKEYNQKFINHLNSDDFFSVKKHSTAKLVITESRLGKGGHFDVFGDLTIKGITKPVIFRANVSNKNKLILADAEIKFNRTHYGIKYGSGSFFSDLGDKMIYDDVVLKVKLQTK